MLGKVFKSVVALAFLAAVCCAPAWAGSVDKTYEPAQQDAQAGYQAITKVKPQDDRVMKVRPRADVASRFKALSGFIPTDWGFDCILPTPAKRQFVLAPRAFFPRIRGQVRYGPIFTGLDATEIQLDDHLGFSKSGNTMWSIAAHYQFQPRWGIRYAFTPLSMEATHTAPVNFTFGGRNFTAGSTLRNKWERFEHRLGLAFDISRSRGSLASIYAEWVYVQERLSVRETLGINVPTVWDDDKNLASVGLEFHKCLKNFRGNTLAMTGKGGVTFLDDSIGYEAEAALNYMIPIKTGRFGFIKGGYRYAQLKKEKDAELFDTTMDGAFVEVGFLF